MRPPRPQARRLAPEAGKALISRSFVRKIVLEIPE